VPVTIAIAISAAPGGDRHEHPRAEPVDEPAVDRRGEAGAEDEAARDRAGERERPGLLAQEEDHRQAVDADRQAAHDRRGEQPREARRAEDAEVGGHSPSSVFIRSPLRTAKTSQSLLK
jgi:hypothetical protein